VRRWLLNILVSIDQFVNTVLGGDPDETISSRAAKSKAWPACVLCRVLDWLDKGHCRRSIEPDEGTRV